MIIMEYPTVEIIETDVLSDTDRGANGFGSSGK
jgi:dUTPase